MSISTQNGLMGALSTGPSDPFEWIIHAIKTRIGRLIEITNQYDIASACRMKRPGGKVVRHWYYMRDGEEITAHSINQRTSAENRSAESLQRVASFSTVINEAYSQCASEGIHFEKCDEVFSRCKAIFDSLMQFAVFGPSGYRARDQWGGIGDREILPLSGLHDASNEASRLFKRLRVFKHHILGATNKPFETFPNGNKGKSRGKNIDARMLKVMAENQDSYNWTARKWSIHLQCSDGTIKGTKTWKERLKAGRALIAVQEATKMEQSGRHSNGRRKAIHKSQFNG
jgi:hypothetical protein